MTRTNQLTSPHLRPPTADLNRLLAGEHHDPHSILGAHEYGDHTVVRAYRPHAVQVAALVGGERYVFSHIESGLFAVALPFTNLADYRLEISYEGGGDSPVVHAVADAYRFLPTLGEVDLHLFAEGRHERLWEVLGAHPRSFTTPDGVVNGVSFAVWAPNAKGVSLIGEFNHWDGDEAQLRVLGSTGVWELFWPDFPVGGLYKFRVHGADGAVTDRADPMAFATEVPPQTGSRVTESSYSWSDDEWMARRAALNPVFEPMSTYEVHLMSWRPGRSYRQLADELTELRCRTRLHPRRVDAGRRASVRRVVGLSGHLVLRADVTAGHARRLPLPGGQAAPGRHRRDRGLGAGAFPERRLGAGTVRRHSRSTSTPTRGVVSSSTGAPMCSTSAAPRYVTSWWPTRCTGCRSTTSTVCGSTPSPRCSTWTTRGRRASWTPNVYGGRENLEAVQFLQEMNATVHKIAPGIVTIAEESTSWPGVTRPTNLGGLGFSMKWNMGWMNDTLDFISHDPVHRSYHHHEMTFSMLYAFSENYVLPISHDEVVHGKGTLWGRMPGNDHVKAAGVRGLIAYQWAHPGKQLLFMGQEFGQRAEWSEERGVDWYQLDENSFSDGILRMVSDINGIYQTRRALWSRDSSPEGYSWIDANDSANNVLSFLRFGDDGSILACVFNFSGSEHTRYRLGLPHAGSWREVLNTDATIYNGTGVGNYGAVEATEEPCHGRTASAVMVLPPLAALWFERA